MSELDSKTALVTGSPKRVGKEIALALADEGADVGVHYRTSADAAEKTAEEIRQKGVESSVFQADLSEVEESETLVDDVADEFGGLDIVVNSASVFYETPFGEVDEDDWNHNIDVNLRAPFFVSQRAAEVIDEGKIVNIAGVGGITPYPSYLPYSASKSGLISLTKGMAKELAPDISVNAVAPATVLSPPDRDEEEERRIAETIPVGSIGSPDDVSEAVVYLTSASEFVTGVVLPVDGGKTA
ncbi:MAG: SDR family oxidoreductase [Halobacteria archaeon]|nr:SDR family oxidoreductase [Halobacteria archaeon]